MIDSMASVDASVPRNPARNRALVNAVGSVVLVVLAAYLVVLLLRVSVIPVDFHVYREAAELIADGRSPYPAHAYPPLSALAAVPFTVLSTSAADFAVKALLIVGVLGTLAVLGVRDWRCYPLAILWPQMNAAVQTGNITIPLALAAALVWRFRDRSVIAGFSLGTVVAAKFVLWPIWLWMVAVGRSAAAAWSLIAGVGVMLASWAIVDFGAMLEYPSRLRQLDADTAGNGYTLDALAEDLGAGDTVARALMTTVALALLVAVVVTGRRGNQMRSFVLAVAAALACSPILWLHYFALLLVPVAVVSPRLSPLWFVPMVIWGFGAGTGNGTTFEATVVIVVVACTLLLAARAARPDDRLRHDRSTTTRPAEARL